MYRWLMGIVGIIIMIIVVIIIIMVVNCYHCYCYCDLTVLTMRIKMAMMLNALWPSPKPYASWTHCGAHAKYESPQSYLVFKISHSCCMRFFQYDLWWLQVTFPLRTLYRWMQCGAWTCQQWDPSHVTHCGTSGLAFSL